MIKTTSVWHNLILRFEVCSLQSSVSLNLKLMEPWQEGKPSKNVWAWPPLAGLTKADMIHILRGDIFLGRYPQAYWSPKWLKLYPHIFELGHSWHYLAVYTLHGVTFSFLSLVHSNYVLIFCANIKFYRLFFLLSDAFTAKILILSAAH